MHARRRFRQVLMGLAAISAVAGLARPVEAHRWRSSVVIGIPGPLFSTYYYPAYYPAYPPRLYYPYPYPAPAYVVGYPPPGWVPGHWEWRTNRWGRTVEVWIPPHLR